MIGPVGGEGIIARLVVDFVGTIMRNAEFLFLIGYQSRGFGLLKQVVRIEFGEADIDEQRLMPSHQNGPEKDAPARGILQFKSDDGPMGDPGKKAREFGSGGEDAISEIVIGLPHRFSGLVEIDVCGFIGATGNGRFIDVLHGHRSVFEGLRGFKKFFYGFVFVFSHVRDFTSSRPFLHLYPS